MKILVLLILTFVPFVTWGEVSSEVTPKEITGSVSVQKENLELEKLKHEVIKLKKDTDASGYSTLLQTGTLIAAIIAALVSFWSAWRTSNIQSNTLKEQRSFNRQERIAQMVGDLGSEKGSVRLATVQSLKEYEDAVEFICNMLRLESDPAVIRAAISSLTQYPQKSAQVLSFQSKLLFKDILNLGTKLVVLGVPKEEVSQRILITNKILRSWVEESEGVRTERELKEYLRFKGETIDQVKLVNEIYDELSALFNAHNNTILAIESVIKSVASSDVILDFSGANLQGIILDGLDVTNINLDNTNLTNASLKKIKLHNGLFTNVIFHNTNFNQADLSKSSFLNCDFKKSSSKYAVLNHTYFEQCKFYEHKANRSTFDLTIFNECNLSNIDFRNSDGRELVLKSCVFYKSSIDTCRMSDLIAEHVKFTNCDIENIRLSRTSAIRLNILNSKCKNLKLKDAYITDSNFYKTTFTKGKGESPIKGLNQFNQCEFA